MSPAKTSSKSAKRESNEVMSQFNALTRNLESEVKKHPYQVLGAAASIGYLFGQGWLRALTRVGFAYLAQQATRHAWPLIDGSDRSLKQETVH
jgi:hypothetical protein